MARNGILVDYRYCSGCYACEVACQSELDLPLNQWGIKILQNGPWPIRDIETGKNTDRYNYDYIPVFTEICNLCESRVAKGKKPSCVHHCQAAIMKFGPVDELVKDLDKKPWQYLWVPPKG